MIAEEIAQSAKAPLTPKMVFDVINEEKLPKTVIATDVGQHQMWTAQHVNFDGPRRIVSSGGLGTMGFGLGAAIGAYVATKDPVVLITGDGSFGMNLNELATAVTYNVPVVIVLMNNGVLGMVRQWQTLFFGKIDKLIECHFIYAIDRFSLFRQLQFRAFQTRVRRLFFKNTFRFRLHFFFRFTAKFFRAQRSVGK